jgi:hypothetical protein
MPRIASVIIEVHRPLICHVSRLPIHESPLRSWHETVISPPWSAVCFRLVSERHLCNCRVGRMRGILKKCTRKVPSRLS